MTYHIRYKTSAAKSIRKLEKADRVRILRAIESLSEDPLPSGVKKLVGGDGEFRIRVGNFRVVYEINNGELIILVLAVGHRREIYR